MKITVPASALRIPQPMAIGGDGEGDQVMPEVNDPVSCHVEGIVTAKNGDTCEVEVRFVNGERPADSKAEDKKATKKEEPSEEDQLKAAAEKADAEGEEY